MEELLYFQKKFDKIVLPSYKLTNREFEDCVFTNCDFSSSNWSQTTFMDCEFIDCNLALIQTAGCSFKNVQFTNCKLLGIAFDQCADFLFQVSFQDCNLDYASFANKKMPKTNIIACSLKEVSFVGSTLTGSSFEDSILEGTIFNNTQLASVDFTKASNYKIDPEYNPMRKAKFSALGIVGLLDKYDIKIV